MRGVGSDDFTPLRFSEEAQRREEAAILRSIVVALAKDAPFALYGDEYIECSLCDAWAQSPTPTPVYSEVAVDALYDRLRETDRHDPECPWRLAREYVGAR